MKPVNGWRIEPLSRFAKLIMGQSPDSRYYTEEENGLPFLQGCAEFGDRFPEPKLHCNQIKKIAAAGSILFSVRAPVGKINVADRDYIIGRGLASITGTDIDQRYLEHVLSYNEEKFRNAAQGSTFEAINSAELSSWPIYHPTDKIEQAKIAEILSTVDSAIEQTEALIAKQQRIKTGLMQDLLTRGIDEHGNIRSEQTHRFKDSPLGRIPTEWEVAKLESFCDKIVDCPHTTPVYTQSGVPCIRTADMEPGHLLINTVYFVDEKSYQVRVARLKPQEGDIIYSREGERLGIASPVGKYRVCLGQRVMLMRPNSLTDTNFLLWSVNAGDFYFRATNGLGATTSPHINVKDIKMILVRKPPHEEQQNIGTVLAAQHSLLRKTNDNKMKLKLLKSSLMQDLLSGKRCVHSILETSNLGKVHVAKRACNSKLQEG